MAAFGERLRGVAGDYMKQALKHWPARWTDLKDDKRKFLTSMGWEEIGFERNRRYETYFQRLIDSRLGLLLLRIDNLELPVCGIVRRAGPAIRRPRLLMLRLGLLKTLPGRKLISAQGPVAIEVVFGAGQFSSGAGDNG